MGLVISIEKRQTERPRVLELINNVKHSLVYRDNYDVIVFNCDEQKFKVFSFDMKAMREANATEIDHFVAFKEYLDIEFPTDKYFNVASQSWENITAAPVWNTDEEKIQYGDKEFFFLSMKSKYLNMSFKIKDGKITYENLDKLFPQNATILPFTFERYVYSKYGRFIDMGNNDSDIYYYDKDDRGEWVMKRCPQNNRFNTDTLQCEAVVEVATKATEVPPVNHKPPEISYFTYYDSEQQRFDIPYAKGIGQDIKLPPMHLVYRTINDFLFLDPVKVALKMKVPYNVTRLVQNVFSPKHLLGEVIGKAVKKDFYFIIYNNTVVPATASGSRYQKLFLQMVTTRVKSLAMPMPLLHVQCVNRLATDKKFDGEIGYFLTIGHVVLEYLSVNFSRGKAIGGTGEGLNRSELMPKNDFIFPSLFSRIDILYQNSKRKAFVTRYLPFEKMYNISDSR